MWLKNQAGISDYVQGRKEYITPQGYNMKEMWECEFNTMKKRAQSITEILDK